MRREIRIGGTCNSSVRFPPRKKGILATHAHFLVRLYKPPVGKARDVLSARPIQSINQETFMRRWSFFVYGVFCHLLFLATYAYMAGFVGNFLVPKSMDSAPAGWLTAVGIDLLLIILFVLQHSIMARPWFKQIWTRIVPQPIERSTYVLMSCL